MEQFSQSGQSVQQYCESAGCTQATFYYWKRKVTTASQPGVSLPARQGSAFVPIVVCDNRSTIDYQTDLAAEAIEELPKHMIRRLLAGRYIGMDDTNVTLIMPSEIPEVNQECSRSMCLIEKMHEAQRKGEKSLAAKMWAYSGGMDAAYDVFDFRVPRHRDGPAEFLASYSGHVMADCYSGNLSVVLAPGSSMTRMPGA